MSDPSGWPMLDMILVAQFCAANRNIKEDVRGLLDWLPVDENATPVKGCYEWRTDKKKRNRKTRCADMRCDRCFPVKGGTRGHKYSGAVDRGHA